MKQIKKIANLLLITVFLMIPIIPRARFIWFLFTIKQVALKIVGKQGGKYGDQ